MWSKSVQDKHLTDKSELIMFQWCSGGNWRFILFSCTMVTIERFSEVCVLRVCIYGDQIKEIKLKLTSIQMWLVCGP